jgi:hypothetical protein
VAELSVVSDAPNPLPLPPEPPAYGYPSPWLVPPPQEKLRRRLLLFRLRLLLLAGLASFVLVTWWLVRTDGARGLLALDPGPSITVRQHLEALNRGDLRHAYNFFSEHYRQDVSFAMYHELVATHWQMFRTRQASYRRADDPTGRTVLLAELLSADGERYVARFTLVRGAGRWWIDDLRWAMARDTSGHIRI